VSALEIVNGHILQVGIDESVDEMASYFNRETVPKVLITTSDRPSQVRCVFMLSYCEFQRSIES